MGWLQASRAQLMRRDRGCRWSRLLRLPRVPAPLTHGIYAGSSTDMQLHISCLMLAPRPRRRPQPHPKRRCWRWRAGRPPSRWSGWCAAGGGWTGRQWRPARSALPPNGAPMRCGGYEVSEPKGCHSRAVHFAPFDGVGQCVQRIVRPSPRSKPIADPEKFLLIDRSQDHVHDGLMDNLVFQRGHPQRSCAPSGLSMSTRRTGVARYAPVCTRRCRSCSRPSNPVSYSRLFAGFAATVIPSPR